MTDWNSPEELAKDGAAFNNLMHALLGLYLWEFVTSLDFEWKFITGRKRFRWPLVFYFAGRYCLLMAMIGIAIALNVKSEVNCQVLYTYNQLVGNATIGFASINLSLRTMAVWKQKWYIVALLVAIILGHWSLLLHGVLLEAAYFPGQGCVIVKTSNKILAAGFIYTMSFDALILALTTAKLAFGGTGGRSRLVKMIFSDGLIYFVIAFLANTLASVFMLLNLNPVMSIIFNVPSAILSTIVACRAVRRLSNYLNQDVEQFTPSAGTLVFSPSSRFGSVFRRRQDPSKSGITVPLDSFGGSNNTADVGPDFKSFGATTDPGSAAIDLEAAPGAVISAPGRLDDYKRSDY